MAHSIHKCLICNYVSLGIRNRHALQSFHAHSRTLHTLVTLVPLHTTPHLRLPTWSKLDRTCRRLLSRCSARDSAQPAFSPTMLSDRLTSGGGIGDIVGSEVAFQLFCDNGLTEIQPPMAPWRLGKRLGLPMRDQLFLEDTLSHEHEFAVAVRPQSQRIILKCDFISAVVVSRQSNETRDALRPAWHVPLSFSAGRTFLLARCGRLRTGVLTSLQVRLKTVPNAVCVLRP